MRRLLAVNSPHINPLLSSYHHPLGDGGKLSGIMTPAIQAEVTAQVDLAIAIDKAERAAKAKLKKEAKMAVALKAET